MTGWWFLLSLLSPAAILVAAFVAWRKHRQIAAQDATLKFIAEWEIYNPEWHQARREFYKCARDSNFPKDNQDPTFRSVYLVLHHYELVALAIKNKALDEELYKQWSLTSFINNWNRAASYVHSRRQKSGQKTVYCEFESLAMHGIKRNLTPNPPFFQSLPNVTRP